MIVADKGSAQRHTLGCDYLIAADGASSRLRQVSHRFVVSVLVHHIMVNDILIGLILNA